MTTALIRGSESPLKIIAASLPHAPVLAAIHQDVFEAAWSEQAFVDLLNLPTVHAWLAIATIPAGFVLTQSAADEIEILTVAVCAAQQRAGIGRDLIKEALADAVAKGATRCHLEVAEDNVAAQGLYTALGFAESGRRRGYYARPTEAVDAVLMVKNLD